MVKLVRDGFEGEVSKLGVVFEKEMVRVGYMVVGVI